MYNQSLYNTTVAELMSTDVFSLHPDETMDRVGELMDKYNIHHVPVVDDDNRIVGIVSRSDYNRVLSSFMLFNKKRNEELNKNMLRSLTIGDMMTQQVATIRPEDNLLMAAGMFKENLFRAIPVVDEDKKLQGIITTFDLLIFAYQEPPFVLEKDR